MGTYPQTRHERIYPQVYPQGYPHLIHRVIHRSNLFIHSFVGLNYVIQLLKKAILDGVLGVQRCVCVETQVVELSTNGIYALAQPFLDAFEGLLQGGVGFYALLDLLDRVKHRGVVAPIEKLTDLR